LSGALSLITKNFLVPSKGAITGTIIKSDLKDSKENEFLEFERNNY
jgi:hypothetical protein